LPEAKMAANKCVFFAWVCHEVSVGQRTHGNGAILFYIERPTNLGVFISIIRYNQSCIKVILQGYQAASSIKKVERSNSDELLQFQLYLWTPADE
jgi:hypothetical protein